MSPELLIVFLLALVALVAVVIVRVRLAARRPVLVAAPIMAPVPPPPAVVTPEPTPAPPPVPTPALPKPARDLITIRLVSASGHDLGTMQMDRKARRPTLSHRPRRSKATATFVADRQQNGQFVYRQVGQERE